MIGAIALYWIGLTASLVLVGCAAPSVPSDDPRLAGVRDGDLQRILAPPRPPLVVSPAGEILRISPRNAARISSTALAEQRGARRVQIAAVPLLRSTPEGAAFLAMTGHRALAQGEPAASCPALSVAPPDAPTAALAAEASLSQCAVALTARGAPTSCGCRLIALDGALLAPLRRFAFAPAVSALLISEGQATRLIAEADLQDGIALIRLRNASGEVGVLRVDAAGNRVAGIIGDITYAGERHPFGFRRGRLAERITLTGEDGARVSLLIGVERRDATPK